MGAGTGVKEGHPGQTKKSRRRVLSCSLKQHQAGRAQPAGRQTRGHVTRVHGTGCSAGAGSPGESERRNCTAKPSVSAPETPPAFGHGAGGCDDSTGKQILNTVRTEGAWVLVGAGGTAWGDRGLGAGVSSRGDSERKSQKVTCCPRIYIQHGGFL